MPSKAEGFGLVALEAISEGRPILVSKESGIAEFMENYAGNEAKDWIVLENEEENLSDTWANEIYRILMDRNAAANRLESLINTISEHANWQNSIRNLFKEVLND